MSQLSDSDVAEFIEIIREDYGIELNPEQARREAEALVHFAYLLSQPHP